MNLERLKFAIARGARIQRDYKAIGYLGKGWNPTARDDGWRDSDPYISFIGHGDLKHWRIHPDDKHLQYGPVSTAFRDMALFIDSADMPEEVELFMDLAGSNWVIGADGDNILIDFTRLFFAEYLADLGL